MSLRPTHVIWAAVLNGAFMVTPDCFLHHRGPYLKYHRATSSKRRVYVSDSFEERHPAIAALLAHMFGANGSNWTRITEDRFVQLKQGTARADVLALITGCAADRAVAAHQHALRGPAFLGLICKIERQSDGLLMGV